MKIKNLKKPKTNRPFVNIAGLKITLRELAGRIEEIEITHGDKSETFTIPKKTHDILGTWQKVEKWFAKK